MKKLIFILIFSQSLLSSQDLVGKIINEFGQGIAEINLSIYFENKVLSTTTTSDGSFSFNITEVENEFLPLGYSVSENFPNPFNTSTNLNVAIPDASNVKVEIYNILGELVLSDFDRYLNKGEHFLGINLEKFSDGYYLARIIFDNKFSVIKKLVHISGNKNYSFSHQIAVNHLKENFFKKNNLITEIIIDSLVAQNNIIGKVKFTELPNFEIFLDLGELIINRFCEEVPTLEYLGQIYHTVKIANQCWMKENLKVGKMIHGNIEMSNNNLIEKYCYDNDSINCAKFGGYYQWDEAMNYSLNFGNQGICPDGWHIPTKADYEILFQNVNYSANALKEIGVGLYNGEGTNSSGFSALLGGYRSVYGGEFMLFNDYGVYWISEEDSPTHSFIMRLIYNFNEISTYGFYKKDGLFVRCIKNN